MGATCSSILLLWTIKVFAVERRGTVVLWLKKTKVCLVESGLESGKRREDTCLDLPEKGTRKLRLFV